MTAAQQLVPAVVALDAPDPILAIRAAAPDGVARVVEVALSDNADLDAAVVRNGAVIAAYATRANRPDLPFWPMLFDNVTIRLLGSDGFPAEAKARAAEDLTRAARAGAVTQPPHRILPLMDIAEAHERADAGRGGRILLSLV